jgi:predicted nucleotidyltransferase
MGRAKQFLESFKETEINEECILEQFENDLNEKKSDNYVDSAFKNYIAYAKSEPEMQHYKGHVSNLTEIIRRIGRVIGIGAQLADDDKAAKELKLDQSKAKAMRDMGWEAGDWDRKISDTVMMASALKLVNVDDKQHKKVMKQLRAIRSKINKFFAHKSWQMFDNVTRGNGIQYSDTDIWGEWDKEDKATLKELFGMIEDIYSDYLDIKKEVRILVSTPIEREGENIDNMAQAMGKMRNKSKQELVDYAMDLSKAIGKELK